HVSGELPVLRQELPALTVGETKTLFFDLAKRNPCLAGCLDALPELFSTDKHVDQNTEVVEQASQVGFLAITISDQLGKFPAHQGTTQRVPPKRQGVECRSFGWNDAVRTIPHENCLDPFQAKRQHCASYRLRVAAAEPGRVCHPQAVGGDG